jgi:ATP-dependent DNA helicase RecG
VKVTAEKAGLLRPEFSWQEPYLVLRLYRAGATIQHRLPPDVVEQLNEPELAGFTWLSTQGWVTRPDYEKSQKLEARAAGLHLKKFFDLGIVERQGQGRATKHRVKS